MKHTPRQHSIISLCRDLNVIIALDVRGDDALLEAIDFVNIVMGYEPPIADIETITQEQYQAVLLRLKEAVQEHEKEKNRNRTTVLVDGTEEQRAVHSIKRQ